MPEIFSPSSLFLLLNLVIGTIVITSCFTSNRKRQEEEGPRTLVRSPSLIDRVKSINLSFHNYSPFDSHTPSDSLHGGYTTGAEYPPALERPPSLLQRLKSVNFSSCRSQPELELAGESEPVLERTPSFLQRLKSLNFSYLHRSEPELELAGESEPVLERTPSFLQRLKSLNFSYLHRSEPEPELAGESEPEVTYWDGESDEVYVEVHRHYHVKRSKSEQLVALERKEAEKLKKSASEKGVWVEAEEDAERVEQRRPQTASLGKTTSFGDEEVDAKADEFINRFKHQLKLQRLDSLLRYRDMLKGK